MRRLFSRLVVWASLLVVCASPASQAWAATCPAGSDTYAQAQAKCDAGKANSYNPALFHCALHSGGGAIDLLRNSDNAIAASYAFCAGDPSPNVCSSLPSVTISVTGQWSVGQGFPQRYTDPNTGSVVGCKMVATNVGAPTLNPYDGKWYSRVSFVPNANPVGGDAAQDGVVKNADGSTPNPAIPTVPTPAPTTSQPSPKACGGGSCYDANTDTWYALDGSGNQISVSGNAARSPGGSCISSGNATLCAGTPTAPSPMPPPSTPITDPPSQVRSSDKTMQINPVTGLPVTVTTVTYSTPGGTTSSGQKPGDQGPASSSTAPTPPNTANGGGDCGSPPVMGGDAALAMIARQQWLTRCGPDKADKNGNGQPDWTEVKDSDGDQYNTPTVNQGDVFKSETIDASNLNQSSWAGNTCPDLGTAQVFGTSWTPDTTLFCRWLLFIRGAVLLGAAILSCLILAGGGKE